MKKISLVIPCYNEEDNVQNFYNSALKELNLEKYIYELIFVNDGSKDNTITNLKKLKETKNVIIKILDFSRNFGKESAMYAGLLESTGDFVTIIDADLQQPVSLVANALEFLETNKEYDGVAFFQKDRKEGIVLNTFKKIFYKMINKMSDVEFVSGASDFRIMNRTMINAILELSEKNRFSKGIFSWIGFKVHYEYYQPLPREHGTTKWSFTKLLNYAISGIVSFSTAPLRLATVTGIFMSIMSFLYMIFVIIQKLAFGVTIPGYTTIVVLILLIGGVQLFCLGIVGEYLSKTYIESKNRPIFILKEKTVKGDKNAKSN